MGADIARKQNLGVSAGFLQSADVPINNEFCEVDPGYQKFFDKNVHLRAGTDNSANSCQGDSGGPMVIREFAGNPWYQIGIVSFGLGTKCEKGIPGFYTKLD